MEGLFIEQGSAELSLQEVFSRFIKEKECENLATDTISYYRRCLKSFR